MPTLLPLTAQPRFHRTGIYWFRLTALLLCSLIATSAHAIPILLQISGVFEMNLRESESSAAQFSVDGAQKWCLDRGGSVIADSRAEITSIMLNHCLNSGRQMCTTYLDGSAKPSATGNTRCVKGVSDYTRPMNSMRCTYRWRFGFYDIFAETDNVNGMITTPGSYEPGMCYFKGLYIDLHGYTGESQYCNGVEQDFVFNNSMAVHPLGYPHGKFYTIAGMNPQRYARMDADEVAVHNDPNPLSSWMTMCYLQDYPLPASWSTKSPQPAIVPGYKVDTWPQEHWWIIFLIIAVVLLMVLLFVVIYCSVAAARDPKELPPLTMMAQRERHNSRAVLMEADPDKLADSVERRHGSFPRPLNADERYETPQQRSIRLGQGFTFGDPEFAERGSAAIYTTDEPNQHADNGSIMEGHDGLRGISNLSARHLAAPRCALPEGEAVLPPPAAHNTDDDDDDDDNSSSDSNVPNIPSRRVARLSRSSRASSQTFSEVEMPQGDEISEDIAEL